MTTQTSRPDAAVMDAIREVVDGTTAGRVFGTPITHDDLVVLPVAKVSGGAGGGSGTGPAEEGKETGGTGGGVGLSAKPMGVFVVKDRKVKWQPAVDVNRVILGGQGIAVAALLVVRALIKARQRR
jgi:uncharacterized spore protein YtfJ